MTIDFEQLKELIEIVGKNEVREFKLESEEFKLSISKGPQDAEHAASATVLSAPASPATTTSLSATAIAGEDKSPAPASHQRDPQVSLLGPGQEMIVAPMVGTFYRAPSPDAEPFVEVGDQIEVGTAVCIIEAMKLMNEIESELQGRVVKILAENGQAVEYGQPLFIVEQV